LPEAASFSSQQQDIPRTWNRILDTLLKLNTQNLLPDLSFISNFKRRDDATSPNVDGQGDDSVVMVQN